MTFQRAIGILIILAIILLVIPQMRHYLPKKTTPVEITQTKDHKIKTIAIERDTKQPDPASSTTKPATPESEFISTDLSEMPATQPDTPVHLISNILAKADKQSLDISVLSAPDLPPKPAVRKPKKISKKIPEKPNINQRGVKPWVVKIAALKADKPFIITGFKQALKRSKIKYNSYDIIVKKIKWIRFVSQPVDSKQKAEQLSDYIDYKLKSLKVKSTVQKNNARK